MKIGTRDIGPGERPYLIAEMSGNHNQSLDRALAIVDAAAASGGALEMRFAALARALDPLAVEALSDRLKAPAACRDLALLAAKGWHVCAPETVVRTPEQYRGYIQASRGEFSCAKPAYVKARSGWVSDRTICYLASGRPAVVQDTGAAVHLIPSQTGQRIGIVRTDQDFPIGHDVLEPRRRDEPRPQSAHNRINETLIRNPRSRRPHHGAKQGFRTSAD